MRPFARHAWLVSLTALTVACNRDDDGDSAADAGPPPLVVATYNAGLADGFVDHARARAAQTIAATAAEAADVLCVQEVWVEDDLAALHAAAADRLPHAFDRDPEPGESTGVACSPEESDPLEMCATTHCGDVSAQELTNCVTGTCDEEINAVSPGCLECLAANLGQSLETILANCASDDGSGSWFAGGAFGTAILSKYELLDVESARMDSALIRRGYLYARIAPPGRGDVHVICTHTSPIFTDIRYTGEAGGWAEEQRAQIEEIVAFADGKIGDDGKGILLGDFNCGPAVGDEAEAELAENYQVVIDAGYAAPYADSPDATCTMCADNPLHGGNSVLIDHVFTMGLPSASSAERILAEAIEITTDGGDEIESRLSDHYGVRITIP